MRIAETLVPPLSPDLDNRDWFEVIDGERVEMPPMSADSSGMAADLAMILGNYGFQSNRGKAFPEMLIRLALPVNRNRRPDVIFVSYTAWAKGRPLPTTNEWDVLPELCVEVVSPHDLADEILTKTQEYLAAGVKQVWVVYPRHGSVLVYDSMTQVRGLSRADTLEGGTVLPGFQLVLAELFPVPPIDLTSPRP